MLLLTGNRNRTAIVRSPGSFWIKLIAVAPKAVSHQAGVGMRDLKSPKLIWLKGILFLLLGLASAGLVWFEAPTLKTALLLVLTIWAFCRAYYFGFYVLEKYVDPQFRFAGLFSLVRYILSRRGR